MADDMSDRRRVHRPDMPGPGSYVAIHQIFALDSSKKGNVEPVESFRAGETYGSGGAHLLHHRFIEQAPIGHSAAQPPN